MDKLYRKDKRSLLLVLQAYRPDPASILKSAVMVHPLTQQITHNLILFKFKKYAILTEGIGARGSVDRATGSGPVDRGFESLRAHVYFLCAFRGCLKSLNSYAPGRLEIAATQTKPTFVGSDILIFH